MTPDAFSTYIEGCRERFESALRQRLPDENLQPTRLHAAMRYSALAPGKRVRPILVYATGQSLGVAPERLDAAAVAVELIHAFSLVHDDLPAMDNDDLRRGIPTCHKAFDEATAILAGDALQTLAFQVLCQDHGETSATTRLRMLELLAQASGSRGMAGGQTLDMEAEGRELALPQLENIHIHKTGALIRACVRMACLIDEAQPQERKERLDHYAKCVGLAFQIRDDILDVESDTDSLGKTQGKDQISRKATYPSLLGLAGAREKAGALVNDALVSLHDLGPEADPLRRLAEYIVSRNR
ncbi:MAG: (2E,6E)-farnesyl diphosphate synthase [Gammaproteobacteria bacterium]|nr:(2E,6E)-farnesyl diphosphate synthase [Gammaproteobacteria bacterium]MBU1655074.1 (2E,6E)-farnesyl diphosphate synthase [Gammaproteobacteria bacterium]MBU1961773.1 (2E,6E)-farnesyl diphosphate synthase [Gammaproteobacteria bacterium]